MLESKKLELRRSEIRQELAVLAAKPEPTEDEVRSMENLDKEYRTAEVRFRAALTAEDTERREAGAELETRSGKEWAEMMGRFEMRQVALALDEGRALDGATAEIVTELREQGGYRGIPVPWAALEKRAGETVASGTPDPISTRPVIDRLFPDSVAGKMGAQMITIESGATEWPVVTSSVSAGWADGETANVAGPSVFATTDKALKPEQNLGIQMRITRKALKQSGAALEQAVRRDMNSAMQAELDKAIFLGTGANGQPLGVVAGASTYGINDTDLSAVPTYAHFLAEVVAFMSANTITSPEQIRALLRPELFGYLEGQVNADLQITEYHRFAWLLAGRQAAPGTFPSNITTTSNALATPSGSPEETSMLLTTSTGGVAPIFCGLWGAVDMIRDPFSDAQSGGLRITALATADVTVARPAQLRLLSGIQLSAS
ncbi:phage major capsid protein [Tropicimonas sediminicola]|uniref:Phage major capsid protein, HK97 family n=1 Tax=Tropicimonas sediminicola TaxID=1031541 RepID=A0A239M604_9RHOB|nr:phage major capsid protein [Tropicimonas sediminicola]SNT37578.1 phage major capsid protein, HK97 family [Tropicimonas sediminicola]